MSEFFDTMILYANIRKKYKSEIRESLTTLKKLSEFYDTPIITASQPQIPVVKYDHTEYFDFDECYFMPKNKEDNTMAKVKLFGKREVIHYGARVQTKNGVIIDQFPDIFCFSEDEPVEIPLDCPPTEPFPIVGSKVFSNACLFNFNNSPYLTFEGRNYAIEEIKYHIDLGGLQCIYIDKEFDPIVDPEETFEKALDEYSKIMAEFMNQLIATDFRYKQYVKTTYNTKKLTFLKDIIQTIADVEGVEIDDDDLSFDYKINPFDSSYDNALVLNALYNRLTDFYIDSELRLKNEEE